MPSAVSVHAILLFLFQFYFSACNKDTTCVTDVPSPQTPLYKLSPFPSSSSSLSPQPSNVQPLLFTPVPSHSLSIESTMTKTLSPSESNAPTQLHKPSTSPSKSAFPSVQPSRKPSFLPTTEPIVSTPLAPLFPSSTSAPTKQYTRSSSPTDSTSPSFQPSPTGLRLQISESPSKSPSESKISTTGPSPAVTVTSPTFGKLQLTDSPVPERVNPYPGPAISDGPDIVCLSSKNDTSETLHFDDDSVSASICNDDADPYRTCIWRTTTSERCDRMVKNKPFVDSGETLIEGTIHLTLSQNPVATSCKNIIQLEKA
eukprot:CCRYP_018053-RB/>CCRYP_018053-RB protein AED:0.34 eAED:0.34 QI:1089/1/0.9/1/0.77/0.6/10/0/313